MHWAKVAALLAAAILPGCDGLFTGDSVTRFPLAPDGRGGYAPVRLSLGPDMNPVALNLHGSTLPSVAETGKWNTYRAVLRKGGAAVASQEFNVNNGATVDSPGKQPVARTMMVVEVPDVADYDLAIEAVGPAQITLEDAALELRRNVRPSSRP